MFVASIWLSSSWLSSHSARQIPSRQAREVTETCFHRMKLVLVVIYKREIADSLLECFGSEKFSFVLFLFSAVERFLGGVSTAASWTILHCNHFTAPSHSARTAGSFENSKCCASQPKHNWVYVNRNKNKLLISPWKLGECYWYCRFVASLASARNSPEFSIREFKKLTRCW